MADPLYPDAIDPALVGSYPAIAKSGGGYVWDAVLEYRVWCHPELGAPDLAEGGDYYHSFSRYQDAMDFSQGTEGAEDPLALVLQGEHIAEPEPGNFVHVRERRVAEWQVVWLNRPRRTDRTIPDFMSPTAPENRLDILRGLAS